MMMMMEWATERGMSETESGKNDPRLFLSLCLSLHRSKDKRGEKHTKNNKQKHSSKTKFVSFENTKSIHLQLERNYYFGLNISIALVSFWDSSTFRAVLCCIDSIEAHKCIVNGYKMLQYSRARHIGSKSKIKKKKCYSMM